MKYWIYFLIRNKKVVYVGQTQSPRTRIGTHRLNKDFDDFRIIECEPSVLNYYEQRWILRFKPEYNKEYPYVGFNRNFLTLNREKSVKLFMSARIFSMIKNKTEELGMSKTEYIISLILEDCKK